jgi:hypothetical protein
MESSVIQGMRKNIDYISEKKLQTGHCTRSVFKQNTKNKVEEIKDVEFLRASVLDKYDLKNDHASVPDYIVVTY